MSTNDDDLPNVWKRHLRAHTAPKHVFLRKSLPGNISSDMGVSRHGCCSCPSLWRPCHTKHRADIFTSLFITIFWLEVAWLVWISHILQKYFISRPLFHPIMLYSPSPHSRGKEPACQRQQKETHPARRNPIFWLQPLMLPLIFLRFQTHPAFGLPPPVHLDPFLPAPPFQLHQALQKKTPPGRINPKFWLQPLCFLCFCFCFQDHLALDLLHVFQLDLFLSVPFFKLVWFRYWFRKN